MTQLTGTIDDFGLDTVSLAGSLSNRLAGVRAAGLLQVMMSASDLVSHPDGSAAAVAAVRSSGLRVTGLRVARGFEGIAGASSAYLTDVAKAMLGLCVDSGAGLLVCTSSAAAVALPDDALLRDLRKLATLALPLGVRVACEALSWGRGATGFPRPWDIVARDDVPNLGVGLDLLRMLDAGIAFNDIDMLDAQKTLLVQLADTVDGPAGEVGSAASLRVFARLSRRSPPQNKRVVRPDRLHWNPAIPLTHD